ncbi:MAG: hypothetical protein Q4B18_00400 [Bacillota bacterium]|nr:hypothetical protein [Bacillota bacterium]
MAKRTKLVIGTVIIFLFGTALSCGILLARPAGDIVTYNDETYDLIYYNQDIFTYYYIGDSEYGEEGEVSPVEGSKFDMVQCEGDLYCIEDESCEAEAYYKDDANYEWSLSVDGEDEVIVYPIDITSEALEYLYDIEEQDRDTAIYFDEIETFATLTKTSKDGLVEGVTELAYYEGSWYWRSEIIDESHEKDGDWPEYVYKLPDRMLEEIN